MHASVRSVRAYGRHLVQGAKIRNLMLFTILSEPKVAWPAKEVVEIAIVLASSGAALTTMSSAPLILTAIAADFKEYNACLDFVALKSENAEPYAALLLSWIMILGLVCSGNLNFVAPIITQFMVLAYIFINVAVVLMVLLKSPAWRPTFKYFHWAGAALAVVLCCFVMLADQWYMAVIASTIFLGIYMVIHFKKIQKDWGDGIKGAFSREFHLFITHINTQKGHTLTTRNTFGQESSR